MICALCKEKEADKKNTHYLTDSIIRSCLNEDGSNERERGFYFDMSSNTPYVNFNFQRVTSIEVLEEALGRVPTDEEIEKAKEIPFSVDYVFCSDCEKKFTEIETPFIENILPKLRNEDLESTEILNFDNVKIIKIFFYLQVWRNAICEDSYKLSDEVLEELRLSILDYNNLTNENIPIFPIHITYLNVTGEQKNYTSNIVGSTNDKNPNIIIMNDFVIQFFETKESVNELDFYGLNESNFKTTLCEDNNSINFNIFNNERRLQFINDIQDNEKVKKSVKSITKIFLTKWISVFRTMPSKFVLENYLKNIVDGDNQKKLLLLSEETIKTKTNEFIRSVLL